MPGYLVLFIFVYISSEMGSNGNETKVVPVKIMTHVSHYTALFTCSQVCERASSTVQVVGKFWSLDMHQISYKNYILDFPEDYLR